MRIDLSRSEKRLGVLGVGAFGLSHVVAPQFLLRTARVVYGFALDVEFRPRGDAARRVRLIGFVAIVGAVLGWRRLEDTPVTREPPGSSPEQFDDR